MNDFHAIDAAYLRPSRTLETILLKNRGKERILYIYNYEGVHFRVFNNLIDIISFFDDKFEPEISFETEDELDAFLENIELDNKFFDGKGILGSPHQE